MAVDYPIGLRLPAQGNFELWPDPPHTHALTSSTRSVEAFLEKTAIAYHPFSRKSAKFWRYAIAVFFKNASTLRVPVAVP